MAKSGLKGMPSQGSKGLATTPNSIRFQLFSKAKYYKNEPIDKLFIHVLEFGVVACLNNVGLPRWHAMN